MLFQIAVIQLFFYCWLLQSDMVACCLPNTVLKVPEPSIE